MELKFHIVQSNQRHFSVLLCVLIICLVALQLEGLTVTREAS